MFRNAKVRDRVFDVLLGWGVVDNIDLNLNLPLRVKFDVGLSNYTLEGKTSKQHIRPRLYWDEIKFEIPKKPFDLKAEFDKLEVKKFVEGEINDYISYSYEKNYWWFDWSSLDIDKELLQLYFKNNYKTNEFVILLNKHKITPEQLRPLMIKKLNEVYGE